MGQLDVDLVHDLKASVDDGSLVLQLQPEIDLASGGVVGMEIGGLIGSDALTPIVSMALRLRIFADGSCTLPSHPTYVSPNSCQSQPASELSGVLLSLATSSFQITAPVVSLRRSTYSGPRLPGSSRPAGPRVRPAPWPSGVT